MKAHERRAEARVPITRRGTLGAQSARFPCLIQNFSSKGFLIMCIEKVPIGEILELKSELSPQRFLQCKVEVRHVTDDCLGTKVMEMSEFGLMLCRQLIDEHISYKGFR